jgi:hypothetical protein
MRKVFILSSAAKSHATIEFFNFTTNAKRVAVIESWLLLVEFGCTPDERFYAQLIIATVTSYW